VFEQKLKMEEMAHDQVQFRAEVDLLKDHMMDMEMSVKGAHHMVAPLKDNVQDLNDTITNISNQAETIWVEDILWCRSRIARLEKPNNPTNRSLWELLNHFVCWVEDQEDKIVSLKASLLAVKGRTGKLEMLSVMIQSRVQVLEEAMEIDPPTTDLTSEDLDYQDVDDGGVMLVEDLEDEGNEDNVAPIPVPAPQHPTPFPGVIVHSLIPIEDPVPVALVVEAVDANAKGEDDVWYIPPVYHQRAYPLDEYSSSCMDPVPDYMEDVREDPLAGPRRDDLLADGFDDKMWAELGVLARHRE
jgi:hypothetical protein